ncbi:MAG: glycosyltransferase family 4 protein [Roseiflexaceae bacterium]|nr:glycosyltransferase family 4 protein [Roseiflexaceae bacterium]
MPKPALTILSPLVPHPPVAGSTIHIWNVAQQLARFYAVSLFANANATQPIDWGTLEERCAEVGAFQRTYDHSLNLDPPAVRQEYSAALEAHVRRRWAEQPPEIVQIEFTTMLRYVHVARTTNASVVSVIHSLGFLSQIRRARTERDPRVRLRRLIGALSFWQFELRALARCDLVISLGTADRDALARWLPRLPVVLIPSGIDRDVWQPCFDPTIEHEVLFVGNFLHPPNLEGALWLAREVWPLVQQAHPNARLTLAGREPPPEISALASQSISVPGTLDDMRPLFGNASVFVAPIFWGSGIRIKLLEALATGVPIVATTLSAEGMDVAGSAIIADEPRAFADGIVKLLTDRELRMRMSAVGPKIVQRDYDWQRLAERMAGLYQGLRAGSRRGR